jgi:uncharacterized protein YlxW (UPF0749 family)
MKNKISAKKMIIGFFAVVFGVLLIRQIVAVEQGLTLTKSDNLMQIAYGIIEESKSIFDLQSEYTDLKTKNDSFSFDVKDKAKMKDDVQNKTNEYRATNGLDSVTGRGIEIKVEGTLLTEEIVDLINGIRNTKPDAIAINNRRVVYRSYFIVNTNNKLEFDSKTYDFPIYIEILGDPDSLTTSLNRPGGILDVLKKNSFGKLNFSVERKDSLTLPPYDTKLDFRYVKAIN